MEKAPLLPEFLKEHDIMYSPHSSEDVFNETLLYCSQLFGTVHSADNFEVQASFGIGSTLYVSFNIYTVLFEQVELTGIYMHLLNGDYLGYQSLYRVFSERVQESYSLVPYFDQPQATKKRKLNVWTVKIDQSVLVYKKLCCLTQTYTRGIFRVTKSKFTRSTYYLFQHAYK